MITIILGVLWMLLKIAAVLLFVFWTTFTQWSFTNTKSWKEKKSMQRWFLVVTALGIFGVLTQWIMFIPAWYFRNKKKRFFSWWLDDSRFNNRLLVYSEDYYIYLDGRKETFWIAYRWHMRNMIWNLQNKKIFKVKPQTITEGNQNITIKRLIKDTIRTLNGPKLKVDGIYGQFAGLKYFKNGVSTWQTMNGEQISKDKSIVGTGFYFYLNKDQPYKDNQLNWTFTSCKLVKTWFFGWRWRTIQIGSKQSGYSRQLKYQKNKPIR